MNQRPAVQNLTRFMTAVLMPLALVALVAFALACGALVYTSFGGNGLGVAAMCGAVSGLAVIALILAAYLYRPKTYRQAVTAGLVNPVKLF